MFKVNNKDTRTTPISHFSYLNISSIRNKFGDQQKRDQMDLSPIISLYVSITCPYILHIIDNKGGFMIFVKSRPPSRRFNDFKISSNMQFTPLEINLRKEKQLHQFTTLRPRKSKYFFWNLPNLLEIYTTRYEKVIIYGDFSIGAENKVMKDFFQELVHRFTNRKFKIFIYEDKFL